MAPDLLGDGLVGADLLDALEADSGARLGDGHAVLPRSGRSPARRAPPLDRRTVSAIRSTTSESSSSVDVKAGAMSVWSPA